MAKQPLVSVIVPTFKSSRYLKESIQSIENQTYSNWEMIVVDDTPEDDGTQDILNSFNDFRIKYIKPEQRLGMVKSLNYAVKLAQGDFIARMDADDISHSERFERQVNYLLGHENVGVVGCNCYTIDESDHITGCILHPTENTDIKTKMMFNVAFIHPSVMMRKELLTHYQYNEECFCCEDYEFWSRLMKVTNFHNLSEKLVKYRILNNGAMQSQLKALKADNEYYIRHTSILKKSYDNVLSYYGYKGTDISNNYVDLIFAKRINSFSILEREIFLHQCEKILKENGASKYLSRCIAYQWLKMSKSKFWKTKDFSWFVRSLKEIFMASIKKIQARIQGIFFANREVYMWKL